MIALGARLGEMTTSGYTLVESPQPKQRLIHVHASAEELNRVYRADLPVHATMDGMLERLAQLEAPADVPWRDWSEGAHEDYLRNLNAQVPQGLNLQATEVIDMPAVVAILQRRLPADAVITNGAGNFAGWVHRYFRFHGLAKGHKTQLAPTAGAMGYGVPAGIAANLLTGRVAFTITGDGDFLMNGQELATAVQHGAKSIILLLNNGTYGTIRMHQEREYPQRPSGTELHNPDFCALAASYGYQSARVVDVEGFELALGQALESPRGMLIEIKLSPELISTRKSLSAITHEGLKA